MRPSSAPSIKGKDNRSKPQVNSTNGQAFQRLKTHSTSRYGNAYTSFTNPILAQRKFNELQKTGKFVTYNAMIKSVQKYTDKVENKILQQKQISTPAISIFFSSP